MNTYEEGYNLQSYKISLLGESGVGKTSIVNRYIEGKFEGNTLSTQGVCFFSKLLEFPETKQSCKLDVNIILFYLIYIKSKQIWDTAGQERYKSITKIYYQKSNAIIFVYDITNLSTFNSLKQLYNEVKEAIGQKNFLPYIVGNKSDLYEKEVVPKSESEEFAKSIEADIRYISALNGSGIKELFELIGKALLNNKGKEDNKEDTKDKKKKFSLKKDTNKKKKKCC